MSNRRRLTDREIRQRMKSKSDSYWKKRSELRQVELEKVVENYEAQLRFAHDQALKAIKGDFELLVDKFIKQNKLTSGFTFDRKTAKQFLNGTLSRDDIRDLKRRWERRGADFDLAMQQNRYLVSRFNRKQAMEMTIKERMQKRAYDDSELITEGLAEAITVVDKLHKYDLSIRTGIDLGNTVYSRRDVNAILSINWSGMHYSDRIWRNSFRLADKMNGLFLQREMLGLSTRDIIKQLARDTHTSDYDSARLIRTEANALRSATEQTEAEALGIDQYLIIATLDRKTSEICQELDGSIGNWKEAQIGIDIPPFHPNCRTIASDYIPDLMDLSKIKRVARNPETGQTEYVPADMTYKEWLKSHGLIEDEPGPITQTLEPIRTNPELVNEINIRQEAKSIRLTGIDEQFRPVLTDELTKVFERYPIDLSRTEIKTNSNRGALGQAGIGVRGRVDRHARYMTLTPQDNIILNKNVHKNLETSSLNHTRITEHFGKPYDSPFGTLWHEYAHQIDYKYTLAHFPEFEGFVDNLPKQTTDADLINKISKYNELYSSNKSMSTVLDDELFKAMKSKRENYNREAYQKEVAKVFGEYASSSKAEMLAEGFATINLTDPNSFEEMTVEFDRIFNNLFDDVLRKRRK